MSGSMWEQMNEPERALRSFESALRHNPYSLNGLARMADLCKNLDQFDKVVRVQGRHGGFSS